jgi:hypothetical protein
MGFASRLPPSLARFGGEVALARQGEQAAQPIRRAQSIVVLTKPDAALPR